MVVSFPFNSQRAQLEEGQAQLIEFPEVAINLTLKFPLEIQSARPAVFLEIPLKRRLANTLIIIEIS